MPGLKVFIAVLVSTVVLMSVLIQSQARGNDIGQGQTVHLVPAVPPRASYTIDCRVEAQDDALSLNGTEVIRFTNESKESISRLALDWLVNGNRTLEVTINGKPVSTFTDADESSTGSLVLFNLPEPLASGEDLEIHLGFFVTAPNGETPEKLTLKGWYPRLWWGLETHGDFDVKVDAPPGYAVGASGRLDPDSGYYHAERARSFGLFLGKGYEVIESEAGGVLVRCLHTAKGQECARVLLATAVDVINFYRERFGFYPHSSLTIVPGMDRPAGGYPVATAMVAIHGQERMSERPELHWKWITAHEIGHQYWIEHVLAKDLSYWLMIGLGIYADREYVRARGLELSKHEEIMARYVEGVRQHLDTRLERTREEIAKLNFDFNNVVTHGKGYSFVSALACLLGKETFDRVYRHCLEEYAGRQLGVDEFQRVCEKESGQDLEWFFHQWVRTNRCLSYEVTSQRREEKDGRYLTTVKVERLGDLEMPVPVEVTFEDGTRQRAFTDRLVAVNSLTFESEAPLKDARPDPDGELALVVPPPSAAEAELAKRIRELPSTGAGKKALDLFNEAQKADLKDEDLWGKLGLTLYDGRYYEETLQAFRRTSELSRKRSVWGFASVAWEGHILDILGDRGAALECYSEALKRDPGQTMRHDQYGIKINRQWVERRLREPFQDDRGSPKEQLRKRIKALPWVGAGEQALQLFRSALKEQPEDARLWFKLGLTLFDGNYYEEALPAFRRAGELAERKSVDGFAAAVWQGHILDITDRRNEAIQCYRQALDRYSGDWMQHAQYGMMIDRKWVKQRLEDPFVFPGSTATHGAQNFKVGEIRFDPVGRGKNKVAVRVQNLTDKRQVFAIHIQTRSPNVGRSGVGWGTCFFDNIAPQESKWCHFAFKIYGDVVDPTWVRLRFYNPASVGAWQFENHFLERKFLRSELELRKRKEAPTQPATPELTEAIVRRFKQIQGLLRQEEYEKTWNAFTKDYQQADWLGQFDLFKAQMADQRPYFWWAREKALRLVPRDVSEKGDLLVLNALSGDAAWKIDFALDEGGWKIDWIDGYVPPVFLSRNWMDRLLPAMQKRATDHFDIYYAEGSTAERDIDRICHKKEKGFRGICEFLRRESHVRVRLVFFEDREVKLRETGHQGAGWAFGTTIVEVYNETEQLDPYHETAHILMREYGNPPALFNEGFAVYMSERLGAPPLKNLGGGEAPLYKRAAGLKAAGDWIPLEELLTYTDIGPSWSRPPVSYAEAGAFVKFLVEAYGTDRFLEAYGRLKNSRDETIHAGNQQELARIYGKPLDALRQEWHEAMGLPIDE